MQGKHSSLLASDCVSACTGCASQMLGLPHAPCGCFRFTIAGGWDAQFNPLPMRHDHELMAPFCLPEYKPTEGTDPYYVFKVGWQLRRKDKAEIIRANVP